MVHLKYVDNLFDEKMMYSISKFHDERSFYDCISREFLNDQAFQHLEHTFYMYFLTGDAGEWIGYVLFSNENLIQGYYHFAKLKLLDLINNMRTLLNHSDYEKEFDRLEELCSPNNALSNSALVLEETIFSLKKICVLNGLHNIQSEISGWNKQELESFQTLIMQDSFPNDSENILEKILARFKQLDLPQIRLIDSMFSNYYEQIQEYLLYAPNYFYLDIVLALPKHEESILTVENQGSSLSTDLLAERKYYGFIREAISVVEEEINKNFRDAAILLKEKDKDYFLVNSNSYFGVSSVPKAVQKMI